MGRQLPILGNDIETLIKEENQQAINASTLAGRVSAKGGYTSGVYFYKLRAGSFVQTKKMILLK